MPMNAHALSSPPAWRLTTNTDMRSAYGTLADDADIPGVENYRDANGDIVIMSGCPCYQDDALQRIVPIAFATDLTPYPANKIGFVLSTLVRGARVHNLDSGALMLDGVVHPNMLPYIEGITASGLAAHLETTNRFAFMTYTDDRATTPVETGDPYAGDPY